MDIKNVESKLSGIQILIAKIEQHLKEINGSIIRHEKDLNKLEQDVKSNSLVLAKIGATAGITSGAVVTGAYIVLKLIGI